MRSKFIQKKMEEALKRVFNKLENNSKLSNTDFYYMKTNSELFKNYSFKKNRNCHWYGS